LKFVWRKKGILDGKLLSYGDRIVLINPVWISLPMFTISFLYIPQWTRKRLKFFGSCFFWQSNGHKRNYRLAKWNIICWPKDQGVLRIGILKVKKCLLSKCLLKFFNDEGVWQKLLHNKYPCSQNLS
jgi:hypothetical protein